jgi:WD repeat-containing protein 1 (actin-interacting protein 1)
MCFLHGPPFKFNSKSDGIHKGFVFGTAFSPDGGLLVTVGADRRIQLYDGKTGEATTQIGEGIHTGSIFSVSWAQDGKKLVTASADQTVRLWDVEAGKPVQAWKFGEDRGISVSDQQVGVVYPHGRTDGLIISLNLDGDLIYLKEGSPKPSKVVQGHNKTVTSLGKGSDGTGKTIWTGSFDGRVCHWDLGTGTGTAVDGQAHTNQVVGFTAASGRTYSIGWDDTLRIVDESAKTFAGDCFSLPGQPKGVDNSNGRIFVATANGIAIYEKDTLLGETKFDYSPGPIASHGSTVAVGADSKICVYKVDSAGKLSPVETLQKSTSQITVLAFSKDGKYLAAGNGIGKIVVYNSAGWDLATDRWSAHTARVTSIAWNDAGTHAISGAIDTNIFVWSLSKPGSRVKALNAHKDGVSGVAWIGSDKIVSTGGDAAIKTWKVDNLQ